MQVNCRKVHKYLDMKLDYSKVGQVKITMLDYIDETLNAFDKAYPTGVGTKSSAATVIIIKFNKYCKKLMQNKLCSFIIWWQKYYLLPSGPGRTPAPQFHSSPQE